MNLHPIPSGTLSQLFERQVEHTPNETVVAFAGVSLSYSELNQTANRIARLLVATGAGPEEIVGLLVPRSIIMVTALLGIMKSGAAYLPLDPEYPISRLESTLNDAAPLCVVTLKAFIPLLPQRIKLHILDSTELCTEIAKMSGDNLADGDRTRAVSAEDPACVMYTSGSTGLPKGVVTVQKGLVNRICWMKTALDFGPKDLVIHKTPITFDVSIWEIFLPICHGACLEIILPGKHRDPRAIAQLIIDRNITTVHFVPSMLNAFLEHPLVNNCLSLKRVVCSGETLSEDLTRRFYAKFSGVDLYNLYGPTEASIDVTMFKCSISDLARKPPIGKAIWNTSIYILSEALEQQPDGVPGELYIAGLGLARGYLRQLELTAERFVADPFGGAGGRMYRTGDYARVLSDGNLDFLGRSDTQVKVRGFRVEMGEVEAVITNDPAVRAAAVTFVEDSFSGGHLIGYVVPTTGKELDTKALRRRLRENLPDHMIPGVIHVLDQLPLTISGKLDRLALPI